MNVYPNSNIVTVYYVTNLDAQPSVLKAMSEDDLSMHIINRKHFDTCNMMLVPNISYISYVFLKNN